MPRPDRHNEVEINLLTFGSLSYLLGGRRTTVEADRLAVFWAAIPHQIVEFEGDSPYFVVTLPLSDFLSIGLEQNFVSRVMHGELVIDSKSDETDRLKFKQWERELRKSNRDERAARLEVEARMLRFSRVSPKRAATKHSPQLSRADHLACYIAKNYQQPLTSTSIAEANGVHPNYAMNLFRKTFGTTMNHFITEHRISHAQRLLATGEETILDVAFAAGFQSLSRFNEAFKSACGCSPRDYRNAHRIAHSQLSVR
ncbi:Melibiose operon regulatory protein [Crateriforma conspicua]|uniref:Melibiose operon regulatory protein n=2 Tax=Crateriforma conspicua TaxID=2527996 RepID=A0A5C6FQ25_9PLAN|nr:Melibiose operon regulatory protein [Crateriforma conspicua]